MRSDFIESIPRKVKFNRIQGLVIRNIFFITLVTLILTFCYTLIRLAFNIAF